MRIISASRRTDIAAFYPDWLMNRVRDGCVRWMNPFSKAVYSISLRPEDVSVIVFCSKNYLPLLPHLDELDARGYRMVFHFTITGLPRVFESNVPDAADMVECARVLSARYGSESVFWRYDPIVMSSVTDESYHIRRFSELSTSLEGVVQRCYFSFACFYAKVLRNNARLKARTGIECHDLPDEERIGLANRLADIAAEHRIEMLSCCGEYLVGGLIRKGRCMDAELLFRLHGDRIGRLKNLPTRKGCGCCECADIGTYDTCPHGCVYCYANANPQVALRRHSQHDPTQDILCGPKAALDMTESGRETSLTLGLL